MENTLGTQLKALRRERGLTLIDLSERLAQLGARIDSGTLSRFERGSAKPSPDHLVVLSLALEAPGTSLFGDAEARALLERPGVLELLQAYARGGVAGVAKWLADQVPEPEFLPVEGELYS